MVEHSLYMYDNEKLVALNQTLLKTPFENTDFQKLQNTDGNSVLMTSSK